MAINVHYTIDPMPYYHPGTRSNAMKSFCPYSLSSHLNVLTIFPHNWVDAHNHEGLETVVRLVDYCTTVIELPLVQH